MKRLHNIQRHPLALLLLCTGLLAPLHAGAQQGESAAPGATEPEPAQEATEPAQDSPPLHPDGSALSGERANDNRTSDRPLPLDEVRMFTEVLDSIRRTYIQEIDDRTLLENAIRGMLAGIDPHSSYLANEDYDLLQENTSGEFGGLGVEVGVEDGYITIIAPIDGSPADRAGVQAGDTVIRIDDTPTTNVTLEETINLMRGAPGTETVLTIMREGVAEPFDITVTRDVITARSVRSRMLEPGYGYIRIAQFAERTGNETVTAIEDFHARDGELKGLILDLRNNPGGVLQASVEVADAFLTEGLIVYTEGRAENSSVRYEADSADPSQDVPLVVLINEGSASASEVVAGALQDQGRAIIMGTQSFGKGSVQTVVPLTDNRAIKLTTALYYTPNGRSIQARGIVPNIVVQQGQVTSAPANLSTYREEDLNNHLENNDDADATPSVNITGGSVIVSDYQLNEALNILKGLNIVRLQR